MADTIKAADVPNGEVDGKDPTIAGGEGEGEGEAEKTNGEAVKEETAESKVEAENEQDSKDAAEEQNDEAKSNGNDEEGSTHKRKDSNDHYRNDNKRTRGGGDGRGRGRGRGGGRGGSNWTKNNKNIVRTFDDQPESNDPVEIRRQVEFYFSDSNLPVDGYLLGMCKGSVNREVDLRSIHSFKRMRHFQPFSAVVDAVKESSVLNVDERDNTAYLTRKIPLDEKFGTDTAENKRLLTTDTMERSIYAKGFGEETKSTHLDIEEFFAPYGPINSIRLRRTEEGDFKGSVFIEFSDQETQKRFLELDPKPTWGENDKELQIMTKQEYVDEKHKGILDGNVRPKSPRRSYGNHGGFNRGRGRGGGFKDRRYSDKRDRSRSPGNDDWKSRRDRDQRNGNRNDKRGGGRGGRGRGRGGRGGRDDRKPRRDRDDDDGEHRSRSRSPVKEEDMPDRAEAEKIKEEKANGAADVEAGAEKAEGGSKKRSREADDDDAGEGGEAKKAKEDVAA